MVRTVVESCKNIKLFWLVVWRFRWWDFSFQEEVIDKMLEICEKRWSESHYVGWQFTLGRIKVVRRFYSRYKEAQDFVSEWKWQQKFHREYARLLPRLWD